MKIRCLYKTGQDLKPYEFKSLTKEEQGRFGITGYTEYNQLDIGKEYLVMGMIMFDSYLAYVIDNDGLIFACPCQLFEIVDNRVNSNWHFRTTETTEDIYPYIQAMWGFPEMCLDKKSYESLIIEHDEEAMRAYFKRKIELEKD